MLRVSRKLSNFPLDFSWKPRTILKSILLKIIKTAKKVNHHKIKEMVGKKMSQQVVLENNGVGIGFYETLPNSQNSQMKLR